MITRNLALFLIIFLEGYVVLSTELLAIRLLIPFTGNSTHTVSIIIAAVLMPLAFGYYSGGQFKPRKLRDGRIQTVRKRLLLNLSLSAAILTAGLSYPVLKVFFESLMMIAHIGSPLVMTTLYCAFFLVLPVFLMGQTVPLVSNYFRDKSLSHFAGKVLFLSTLGSFMGAVFCTLILMAYVGVHYTATVSIGILLVIVFLLAKNKLGKHVLGTLCALVVAAFLNSEAILFNLGVVSNNQYNTVRVYETGDKARRVMQINSTYASAIYTDSDKKDESVFPINKAIEDRFIASALNPNLPDRDILVIGSGGFTMGRQDNKNKYTYIDVDPKLKDVAEQHFLLENLGPNKTFIAEEARAYLAHNDKKYDLIIIDAFQSTLGIPEHLVTREFFGQVKAALRPGGRIAVNFVGSATFADPFTVHFDTTFRSVFPTVNREVVSPYSGWLEQETGKVQYANVLYSYFDVAEPADEIYTDNLNRSFMDRKNR